METKEQQSETRRIELMQKVAKLMDKAASAKEMGSLAEAEAFTLKVGQLMSEYNLTEWEINKARPEQVSAFKIENTSAERVSYDDYGRKGRPGGFWPKDVMQMLCQNFMCEMVYHKMDLNMTLFGTATNLQTVLYLFSYLDNLLPGMALRDWKAQKEVKNRYQYMRSWIAGAVIGLNSKLQAEASQRQANSNGHTGLMLYNVEAITLAKKAEFEVIGKGRNKAPMKWTAASREGYKKGKDMTLAAGIEAGETDEIKLLN